MVERAYSYNDSIMYNQGLDFSILETNSEKGKPCLYYGALKCIKLPMSESVERKCFNN